MRRVLHNFTANLLSFRRDPLFAFGVVATLALGIAPNCVIFAIMDSIYFRPLPYPAQHRLALLNLSHKTRASLDEVDAFTFAELQRRTASFESVAAYRNASFNLNSGDRPERFPGQLVTPDFFRTLGILPSLGRPFRPDECRAGGAHALIISDRTWKDYFSSRSDIVGLAVRVDGVPSTIVGVMPPHFTSFMEGRTARVWAPACAPVAPPRSGGASPVPLDTTVAASDVRAGNAIARLKADTSLEQARLQLASAHSALARQFPDFYRNRRPILRDFRGALFGGFGPGIRMLAVIVGLLLVIACGNAANLLLGRAVQRAREMAIRTALGARRTQLIRGMLAESLLLAAAATVVGLVIAYWGIRLLWAWTAPIFRVIGVDAIAFDRRVLVFSALLTVVTTLLFGMLPALRGTRADIAGVLGQGASAPGRRRRRRRRRATMSRALVVSQVVLCVVTMIGATLVLRSFLQVSRVSANPGFRPQGLLIATLPQPGGASSRPVARLDITEETERRMAAISGVERVALTNRVPFLEGGAPTVLFKRAAGAEDRAGQRLDADVRVVDADFFAVMSIPLIRGRVFTTHDNRSNLAVVVVGNRMARTYWDGADPLGDRLLIDGTWRTVVGVVGSTIQPSPFRPSAREAFVPYLQAAPSDLKLLVQSYRPVASLASEVRQQVRAVDPDQPVTGLRTMEDALDDLMSPFRLILVLMTVFGTIALSLSAVGLYGVMAHDVSRRTREVGIRMAVGARKGEVVRMVVRDGLRLAAVGLAVGLLFGLALAKILPSELVGARGLSFYHYAAIAALWLAIALTACLVPARRAAGVDPMSALRCE